jgi:hypothetical protein
MSQSITTLLKRLLKNPNEPEFYRQFFEVAETVLSLKKKNTKTKCFGAYG